MRLKQRPLYGIKLYSIYVSTDEMLYLGMSDVTVLFQSVTDMQIVNGLLFAILFFRSFLGVCCRIMFHSLSAFLRTDDANSADEANN